MKGMLKLLLKQWGCIILTFAVQVPRIGPLLKGHKIEVLLYVQMGTLFTSQNLRPMTTLKGGSTNFNGITTFTLAKIRTRAISSQSSEATFDPNVAKLNYFYNINLPYTE